MSELEVLDNQEAILEKVGTDRRLQKVFNKSMFCSNKSYNKERALTLMSLL